MRRAAFALLSTALFASCSSAPSGSGATVAADISDELAQRLERLAERFEELRVEHHVPGMAVAVVRDDEIVFARGFGAADLEEDTPATPETVFAAGSTTKAFTAALAAMLVDEDRLAWEDPVARYLPYFTPELMTDDPDAALTIADALSHRSGFTRMSLAWAGGGASREEVLRTAASAEPWETYRESFLYNNVMVLAAAEAAAVAAGESWDAMMQRRLLEPLGMASSTLSIEAAQRDDRLAQGYAFDSAREEFRPLPMRSLESIAPAGSLNSNVLDMAQWVRLMLGRGELEGERLVSAARFPELWGVQAPMGPDAGYGLGWFLSQWEGRDVVEHGGNIDGFSAQVGLLPDEGLGFVWLSNASSTPLQQLSLGVVWEELLGEEEATGDGEVASAEEEGEAPGESYDAYVGRYKADFGSLRDTWLTVQVNDAGDLAVDVPGQMLYALKEPDEAGRWYFALTNTIAVSFAGFEDGVANVLIMHQGGFDLESPREGWEYPIEEPLESFEPYLGSYQVPGEVSGKEVNFEVLIRNNHLAVDVPDQLAIELRAPNEEGVRVARMSAEINAKFVEEGGRVVSMIFDDGDEVVTCPRLGAVEPLPTLADVHALRRTDELTAHLVSLGAIRVRSRVRAAQSGVSGTRELIVDGPARALTVLDFGNFGRIKSELGEGRAVEDVSFSVREELAGDRLRQARHGHPFVLWGDWRGTYAEEKVVRRGEIEGRPTIELLLRDGELPPAEVHLDAETGDILLWKEALLQDGLGQIMITTTFADYSEIEGLRIPARSVLGNVHSGNMVFDLVSFETGVDPDVEAWDAR